MTKTNNIALFDLDGTLCDFDGAIEGGYNEIKSPNDPPYASWDRGNEPPYIKNRLNLITSQPGWWENLEELKIGFDILNVARELDFFIKILTKGPRSYGRALAWTEKMKWARHHVPDAKVTITEDKGLVYGSILVDDYPKYIKEWLDHRPRGLVIMPAQEWNKGYKHPHLIRYDGSNLEQVKSAMKIAKERKSLEGLVL